MRLLGIYMGTGTRVPKDEVVRAKKRWKCERTVVATTKRVKGSLRFKRRYIRTGYVLKESHLLCITHGSLMLDLMYASVNNSSRVA